MGTTPAQRGRYRLHRAVDEVNRRHGGDDKPRGRLERLNGPFRLRDDLTAPGHIGFADALDLVVADWGRQVVAGTIGAENVSTYERQLRGFLGVLTRLGQTRVCDIDPNTIFMWLKMPKASGESPSRSTSELQRSAARSFFQTANCLGLTDANPGKVVELPDKNDRYVPPLTDDQIRHLQRVARDRLHETRTPAGLALIMSGCSTRELARVSVADVDLDRRRVWIHGGGFRHRARWLPLVDDWCVDAVRRRVEGVQDDRYYQGPEGDRLLVNRAKVTTPVQNQHTNMVTLVNDLLKTAGLYEPHVVRAESIREWLAVRVFGETGDVRQVAFRLGMASLDAAAHLVGLNWVEDLTTDGPPAHRAGGDHQ